MSDQCHEKTPPRVVITGGELALSRIAVGNGLYRLCSPRFELPPRAATWADWVELAEAILYHEKRRAGGSEGTARRGLPRGLSSS
jgi:hypothetical protein